MNTISYRWLKDFYINNEVAKIDAKKYFGDNQPSIYETGFYSAPSKNWSYRIGIVQTENKTFEVVTQSGTVEAAREIIIPSLK